MKSVYIAFGYTCNHKCLTCPLTTFDRIHRDFTYEDIMHSIGNSGLKPHDHVTISGGEPTLNPSFFPILEYLNQLKVHITILSNATQFADNSMVERLKTVIDVSRCNVVTAIHSADCEIHDRLTGSEGSFNETLTGLNNLVTAGIPLCIKNIINGMNYEKLDEFADFIIDTFPPKVEVQFCVMDYSGRAAKNLELLAVDFRTIEAHLEKALDIFETKECERMRKISIIESPLCMIDPYYWKYFERTCNTLGLYVAPNSETENNASYDVENLCNTSYSECTKCRAKEICPGVWNSSYQVLGNHSLRPFL